MAILSYLHLLAATVWVGGLIVLGGLVPVVRETTADRSVIRAMARRFGVISWTAMGVLIVSGALLVIDRTWTTTLLVKVSLVVVSVVLAAWHTAGAPRQRPARRGAIQGTILLLALVILALATAL